MLKPFSIRNLYNSDPGIVHVSGTQYAATIKSQPDAALTYLDDEDGETILVGSALELAQRLDEPVPSQSTSACLIDLQPTEPMHTFDIQHTPASLAIWREHEAYTSKTLRKKASVGTINNHSSSTPLPEPAAPLTVPSVEPILPNLDQAISSALKGLETHVGAFASFLQDTSVTLRSVAEQTRDADVGAVKGILEGFRGIIGEVGKVGKAMAEAFEGGDKVEDPKPLHAPDTTRDDSAPTNPFPLNNNVPITSANLHSPFSFPEPPPLPNPLQSPFSIPEAPPLPNPLRSLDDFNFESSLSRFPSLAQLHVMQHLEPASTPTPTPSRPRPSPPTLPTLSIPSVPRRSRTHHTAPHPHSPSPALATNPFRPPPTIPSRSNTLPARTSSPSGFGIPPSVTACVRSLRLMGYGDASPHEASRLSVYAAACGGDVLEAVEMIEEDRKAGREREEEGRRMGVNARPWVEGRRATFGVGM
jgi:hypothetical protein